MEKFTDWAKKARHVLRKGEMLRQARIRVLGHLSYYAITDNLKRSAYYVHRVRQILFKWLNRKSQGSSRQGCSPAGERPAMTIVRFGHVAIPQFWKVTFSPLRGVNAPAARRK